MPAGTMPAQAYGESTLDGAGYDCFGLPPSARRRAVPPSAGTRNRGQRACRCHFPAQPPSHRRQLLRLREGVQLDRQAHVALPRPQLPQDGCEGALGVRLTAHEASQILGRVMR